MWPKSLALLAVAGLVPAYSAPPAQADAATVTIVIHHSRFSISHLAVARGSNLRFVIRNTDPIDHEFILGDAAVQRSHEVGTEVHHGTRPGEISVPAVSRGLTTFRFDTKGQLQFACHLPGHYKYGMHGRVAITG